MNGIRPADLLNYAPRSYQAGGAGCCSMVALERTAGTVPSYDSFVDEDAGRQRVLSQDEAFAKLVREQAGGPKEGYTLTLDEQALATGESAAGAAGAAEGERFDVFDFLDMVNPLQHIPVLNYAYRYLTGDTIKPISAILGGAVFAGPVGAASGLVTTVVEQGTGGSLPESVLSLASGEGLSGKVAAYKDIYHRIDANYDYNV